MLPQHDPLFMQAPADHEERWRVKKKIKNLPCAPKPNCNTLHGLHHLRNKSSAGIFFFLPSWLKRCSHYHGHSCGNFGLLKGDRGPRKGSKLGGICPDNPESVFHLCS